MLLNFLIFHFLVNYVLSQEIDVTFEIPVNCTLLNTKDNFPLDSIVSVPAIIGDIFSLYCLDGTEENFQKNFTISPGQHFYPYESPPTPKSIVRVVSTYGALFCPGRYHFEPVWRDAIRTSASLNNVKLCFCGAGNLSTSYSNTQPNLNNPISVFPPECPCDLNISLPYNFILPCHHGSPPGTFRGSAPKNDIHTLTNCSLFDLLDESQRVETRVFWINDVCHGWSRLVMKNRLWYSLRSFYGLNRAKLIMPRSYDMKKCNQDDLFCEVKELKESINKEINKKNKENQSDIERKKIYIAKDPLMHKQKGITLATGEEIFKSQRGKKDEDKKDSFSFITEYVSDPFLVQNYKINMRRYVLLVCTGRRARAFVHNNGKNFYGKETYSEPWDENGEVKWNDKEDNSREIHLNSIVTTGYNLSELHTTFPITSDDFIEKILEGDEERFSVFRNSMHTRLALSIHMAATKFSLPKETRSRYLCEPHETPSCLVNSIRFIHIGCDFQVDSDLIGGNSRMFECNLSPDFHIRDEKDGKIKKEVANDFFSFIGLSGPFNDSLENLDKYKLHKIYDSDSFDEENAFEFLEALQEENDNLAYDEMQFYGELKYDLKK